MRLLLVVSGLAAACAVVACATERTVSREVPVTVIVETTKVVEVIDIEGETPSDLCGDYLYMVPLGELQLAYYESQAAVIERGNPAEVAQLASLKAATSNFANQVALMGQNRFQVCGISQEFEVIGPSRSGMRTLEGISVCEGTLRLLESIRRISEGWDNLEPEVQDSVGSLVDGYVDYCDSGFLTSQ